MHHASINTVIMRLPFVCGEINKMNSYGNFKGYHLLYPQEPAFSVWNIVISPEDDEAGAFIH